VTIGDQTYSLDNLLEIQTTDEAVTSRVRENTFGAEDYKHVLDLLQRFGRYLTVVDYLLPKTPSEFQKIRNKFSTSCKLLADIIDNHFESEAVDLLMDLHIACNCWMRGLHSLVKEQTKPQLISFRYIHQFADEVSMFDPSITQTISKDIGQDCETRETRDHSVLGLMNWCHGQAPPDTDNKKRRTMAVDVTNLIGKCLPLSEVVTEYLRISRKVVEPIGEIMYPQTTPCESCDEDLPSRDEYAISRDLRDDVIKSYFWFVLHKENILQYFCFCDTKLILSGYTRPIIKTLLTKFCL
jgi:hypothetical protein